MGNSLKATTLVELEKKYIEDNCMKNTIAELSRILGVEYSTVYRYITKNKLVYKKAREPFTKKQDKYILDNYEKMTMREIAEELNLSRKKVEKRIEVMIKKGELKGKKTSRTRKEKVEEKPILIRGLSLKEKEFIKNERDNYSLQELADIVGVSYRAVANFCSRNKIKKSS